jgi:diguanylate cyclase (GGDEF)-like protein
VTTSPTSISSDAPAPPSATLGVPRGPVGWSLLALVLLTSSVAFVWPEVVRWLGLPLSDRQMAIAASSVHSLMSGPAAVMILRATRSMQGRSRTAWTAIGIGLLTYCVGNAGWTAARLVAEHTADAAVWDGVLLIANVCILIGIVALPPSANRSAPVRHIDTAIMMVGAICLLWALPISSLLRRIEEAAVPGTAGDPSTLGIFAASNVLGLLIAMGALARCRPDARGEVRPTAFAVILAGLGDLVFSVAAPGGYEPLSRLADAFYVAGLTLVLVAGYRLLGPEVRSTKEATACEQRPGRPAVAELATILALLALAVHQQLYRSYSLVSILLGSLLVLLAIARLGQLEFEQRALTRSLRTTADRLYHESRADALTRLGNRLGLDARLGAGLIDAHEGRSAGVSVFYIDIDHFKRINDGLGHHVGDELLIAVARRLVASLGHDVFRVGGDEFVAVRTDLLPEQAEALADAAIDALAPRFVIGDIELNVTASIGLARSVARTDGADRGPDTPGALLQRADLALYRAKELGRARWAVYEPSLQARADERLELQQGLDRAIDDREMELRHQPVVQLASGRMVGLVASLHWHSPHYGVLGPEAFLPAAIEGGLLASLDALLLDELTATLRLIAAGPDPDLWVAIDLSRAEIVHPGLANRIAETVRSTGISPGTLRVRVSEDTIVDDTALGVVRQLSGLGVQLTVTRFGTGPSSLMQLSNYPASTIEVDSSFVDGLGRRRDDTIIVNAVAGLTSDLGLELAASGIDEELQVRMLADMGCAHGTGRLFGEPVSRERFFAGWFHVQHSVSELPGTSARPIHLSSPATVEARP